MSTDIGQVIRVLDRYIETADDNDETARSIAAAADHVRTDPQFHEALAPLLVEEPSREALNDFKIWMSRTARAVYGIGPSSTAALTDILLAAILLERSSLGGINSRELRNQPDPRDIATVRRLWPRAGTGQEITGTPCQRSTPPPAIPPEDLRPDPFSARTSAEFEETLRQYRRWAGNPTYSAMAKRAGLSVTMVSGALQPHTWKADVLPLELVRGFVAGCGGTGEDVEMFVTAWRRLLELQARSGAPSEQPPLVALDAFERRVMDADLPYAAKAAAIQDHRDQIARQLAELGITETPTFVKKAVRRYAGEQDTKADRDAG